MRILFSMLIRYNKMLSYLNSNLAKRNFMAAELSRHTHSIEKGLTINKPRLGFGHEKQKRMMELILLLKDDCSEYHREVCIVALDALHEYITYHQEKGYSDEMCEEIHEFLRVHKTELEEKKGGIIRIDKSDLMFDEEILEKFFRTRHSIRDFSDQDVNDITLRKALELAQQAPSACNRQGVRVYVLDKEKSKKMAEKLRGVGGFAEKASRIVMITGKVSSYRQEEMYQYIVSASIYAAYLSLTLHAYGLGSCVIQRQVVWSREWDDLRNSFGIPEDEQQIVLLAVGNMKDSFFVPVSHRLHNNEMIRFL